MTEKRKVYEDTAVARVTWVLCAALQRSQRRAHAPLLDERVDCRVENFPSRCESMQIQRMTVGTIVVAQIHAFRCQQCVRGVHSASHLSGRIATKR